MWTGYNNDLEVGSDGVSIVRDVMDVIVSIAVLRSVIPWRGIEEKSIFSPFILKDFWKF